MLSGWGQVPASRCLLKTGAKEPEARQTDTGVDQLDDEGMGLGQGLALVAGHGPLIAELDGEGTQAHDSEGEGVYALQGLDAIADSGPVTWVVLLSVVL